MALIEEQLTEAVIGAAIEVHRTLGPGLLESAYEACLSYEVTDRDVKHQRQVALPVEYKGITIDSGYRIDVLVEDTVVVEIKSVEAILPIHKAQLMTYLKLARKRIGLLLNFNVVKLRDGMVRRVI
jgi:GxxExxY protein